MGSSNSTECVKISEEAPMVKWDTLTRQPTEDSWVLPRSVAGERLALLHPTLAVLAQMEEAVDEVKEISWSAVAPTPTRYQQAMPYHHSPFFRGGVSYANPAEYCVTYYHLRVAVTTTSDDKVEAKFKCLTTQVNVQAPRIQWRTRCHGEDLFDSWDHFEGAPWYTYDGLAPYHQAWLESELKQLC
eukprot:TRINITY_DN76996_c0_g1_i1.p1 TRINITY_DN76996_c0_g1~~TRINITY_DN76996_c0_g1_i1.p1  ORF type:complete len:186 (-),score=6.88 TRINITY_DN76996_c0_g1_i1:162-719(-)